MSKDTTVILLGVWITILPYLGIPSSWRTLLLTLTGFFLIMVGFFIRTEALRHGGRRGAHHFFVENDTREDSHQDVRYERKEGIHSLN